MALIACPECKTQVSDSAATCPSCGKRLRRSFLFKLVLGVAGALVLFVLWALIRSGDPAVQAQDADGAAIDECWRRYDAEPSAAARDIIGGSCRILQERYRTAHHRSHYRARP